MLCVEFCDGNRDGTLSGICSDIWILGFECVCMPPLFFGIVFLASPFPDDTKKAQRAADLEAANQAAATAAAAPGSGASDGSAPSITDLFKAVTGLRSELLERINEVEREAKQRRQPRDSAGSGRGGSRRARLRSCAGLRVRYNVSLGSIRLLPLLSPNRGCTTGGPAVRGVDGPRTRERRVPQDRSENKRYFFSDIRVLRLAGCRKSQ